MSTALHDKAVKKIAVISFNHKKKELIEWAYKHKKVLEQHQVIAIGTTYQPVQGVLATEVAGFPSLIMGGDKELTRMIADGEIGTLILFFDTTRPNRREKKIRDMLQLAINHNIIVGCNQATADLIMGAYAAQAGAAMEAARA